MPFAASPEPRGAALVAGLLVVVLAGGAARAADRDTGLARLAGVWQLDSRVSEDPLRMLRAAPGPTSDRPDEREREASAAREGLVARVRPLTRGIQALTIAYAAPRLTITDWEDRQRVLVVDGKKVEGEEEGRPVRVEAGWKGSDRLVVVIDAGGGERRVEIWELGERGDKLFVTFELYRKGSRQPFRFDRLYNRLTGGSGP